MLASRFASYSPAIRQDRPLTDDQIMRVQGKPGATITRIDNPWRPEAAPSYVAEAWKEAARVSAQFSSVSECEDWIDRGCQTTSM